MKDAGHPGVPLRSWGSKSYDPKNGRETSAFNNGASTSIEGESIKPSAQIPHDGGQNGAPGFDWCDQNRCQGGSK
jgi:hypothetical protein